MKKLYLLISLFLVSMILTGCSGDLGHDEEIKTIKIGVIAPMSGPGANYGEDAVQVYQYFVDKYNETHSDVNVELVIEDGKCDGASATSAAQKLISIDGVDVMLGGICSVEAVAAGQLAQSNKVLSLAPTATEASVGEIGDYVYRFCDEYTMMNSAAEYLKSQNVNRILIVVENEPSAVTMSNALQDLFSGDSDVIAFQSSEHDFTTIAKQVAKKLEDVDYLVLINQTNETKINLFGSLYDEGIVDKMEGRILGNELWNSKDIADKFGSKLNGLKIIQLADSGDMGSKASVFIGEYLKDHTISTDSYLAILEGEGISLLLDTVQGNGNDADLVKEYINNLNENNLRDGLFGNYYFGSKNQALGLKYFIYEIEDGNIVLVQ